MTYTAERKAESDQAGGEGQAGEVGAAPASGLVPDPVQVRADRAHADVQLGGDLRVGSPLRDQRDQLPFRGLSLSRPVAVAVGAVSAARSALRGCACGAASISAYSVAVVRLIGAPRSSAARALSGPSDAAAFCRISSRLPGIAAYPSGFRVPAAMRARSRR
jgi:hypothetical protein